MEGECPDVFELIKVPVKSHTNHGRNAEYFTWVQKHLREHPVDKVVGFNKMPGLDVYYAADVCYAEKVAQEKGFFYRLTSRYRHYAAFERATFEQGKPTQLLMLTDKQIADFQKHYQTEAERFHILPPGIYPDRKYNQQPANSREIFRKKNGITEQQYLLLQVGSDFTRKGVDRSIEALASLPDSLRHNTLLYVVGQDKPRKFEALAEKRGVRSNVHFFSTQRCLGINGGGGFITASCLPGSSGNCATGSDYCRITGTNNSRLWLCALYCRRQLRRGYC